MNLDQFCERLGKMQIDESDWGAHKAEQDLIEASRKEFDSIPVPPFNFETVEREALRRLEEESSDERHESHESYGGADDEEDIQGETEIPGLIDGQGSPEEGVDEDVVAGGIDSIRQKLRGDTTVGSLISWYQGEGQSISHPEAAEAVRAAVIRLMFHKFMHLFEQCLNEREQQEIISLAKTKAGKGDDLFGEVLRRIGIQLEAPEKGRADEMHNSEDESEDSAVPLEEIEQLLREDAASIEVQPFDAEEFMRRALQRLEKERAIEDEMADKLREYFAAERSDRKEINDEEEAMLQRVLEQLKKRKKKNE